MNSPMTTKFADRLRVDFLYSDTTSRFLLLTVTLSSTERSFMPFASSDWAFFPADFDAADFGFSPTYY